MKIQLLFGLILLSFLFVPPLNIYAQTDFDETTTSTDTTINTPEPISEPPQPYSETLYGDFKDYSSHQNDDGTVTMKTHSPYFEDETGNFMPYRVSEDSTNIQVDISGGKFVFHKESGALSTINESGVIIDSDSYVVRGALLDSDVWNNLSVNNEAVTTELIEDDEFVTVNIIRENEKGKFIIEHLIGDNKVKTTAKFLNNFYENHKFAFTQTLNLPDSEIVLNDQTINLVDYVGQSFPREVLIENKDMILQLQQDVFYNSGLGFLNLWSVNISSSNKISLDYANVDEIHTAIGESVELDPTITFAVASGNENWLELTNSTMTNSATIECDDASAWTSSTKTSTAYNGALQLGTYNLYYPSYNWAKPYGMCGGELRYDLASTIPSGSTINSATLNTVGGVSWSPNSGMNLKQYTGGDVTNASSSTFIVNAYNPSTPRYNNAICTYQTSACALNSTAISDMTTALTNSTDFRIVVVIADNNSPTADNPDHVFTTASSYIQTGTNADLVVTYTPPTTVPDTPSAPTASTSNGTNSISWSAPSNGGATITNYQLYRNGSSVFTGNATSYSDSGGTLGTAYTYTVRAYNSVGWSGTSSASNSVTPTTVPSQPTSLATAQSVANQINLTWSAPSSNGSAITNYKIYLAGSLIATLGNVTSYTDTISGSEIGSSLVYTVKATNGVGDSSASSSSAITAWDVPNQVTGLAGVVGIPIVLSWNAPSSDDTITNYKIYRGGSLLTTVANVLTYSDSAVSGGTTYSYTVSSVSAVGEGTQSSSVSVLSGVPFNAPTNVDVTIPSPNSAPLNPVITWTASTAGSATGTLTGYEIFRDTVSIGTVGLVLTYTDTVSSSGTYAYILQSTSTHGNSANSLGDSITTPTAPSQPTLSLTPISTSQIDLSWTASSANGSNLLGYQIERSTDGSSYQTVVANTNTLNTVISATSLSYDSHYWYRVAGINNVAVGTVSAPNDTWTMIDSPTSFLATGVSTSQIDLSWTAPSGGGNILGYHIERESPINSGTWIDQVANTGNTNVVNSITGLASSVTYNLRVSAINSGGSSVPSGESSASSWGILSAPVLDTLTQVSPTEVKLDWTAPTGQPSATGYDIERQLGSGWVAIQTPTATNAITYTDSTLASGDAPSYRIYAINSLGTSLVSNELSITPPSSGGGGGSSAPVVSSVSNLVDIINLNILDDIHRVILGQQLSDSVKVIWDSTDNLEVISIVVADSPVILTFQSVPFIMIADPSGLSEGRINYSVQIPNEFCSSQITINCIEPTQYDIPVEITAKYGTKQLTAITVIKLDMKEETDIPLVFLLGAIALPVAVLAVRGISKKGGHSHRSKPKSSSGSSRKNGSGKSNLSL